MSGSPISERVKFHRLWRFRLRLREGSARVGHCQGASTLNSAKPSYPKNPFRAAVKISRYVSA